ncbi:hypothetical protein Tco_1102156 [Tanacetum coccineum]
MREIVRSKRERELVRVKIHDGNAFWNEIGVNGFLRNPKEVMGFAGIIDFLNASSIRYALTVNPTIYTTCIEQFWSTVKVKTVNGEIFLDNKVEEMTKHKGIYVTPSHTKKVFDNMKRLGKGFSGKVTHLFQTMMVQAPKDMEPIPDEATNEEHVFTPSYDPPQRGEEVLLRNEVAGMEGYATTIIDELTLDQTLIEIKAAKPKAITIDTTTTTTTRPKARGVAKDKGKAILVEPEKPLKKKDQIALDEEVARNLEAQLQAKLEEEERLTRKKEQEATI